MSFIVVETTDGNAFEDEGALGVESRIPGGVPDRGRYGSSGTIC